MGDCACNVHSRYDEIINFPEVIFLELTLRCNSVCPGCGNPYRKDRSKRGEHSDAWLSILEILAPYRPTLRLTGGEPTLHPNFAEIVEKADEKGFPLVVFTNGLWANIEPVISALAASTHLQYVLISLHGAHSESHERFSGVTGSFARTVANIRSAVDAGLPIVTSTVLTRHNYDEIEDIILLGHSLGVNGATFSRYIGPVLQDIEPTHQQIQIAVRAINAERDHIKSMRQADSCLSFGAPIPQCFAPNASHGCWAGFRHATIDPWGNLRPCAHLPGEVGNILEDDFLAVWRSRKLSQWREQWLALCTNCPTNDVCRNACLAQAYLRGLKQDPLVIGSQNSVSQEIIHAFSA